LDLSSFHLAETNGVAKVSCSPEALGRFLVLASSLKLLARLGEAKVEGPALSCLAMEGPRSRSGAESSRIGEERSWLAEETLRLASRACPQLSVGTSGEGEGDGGLDVLAGVLEGAMSFSVETLGEERGALILPFLAGRGLSERRERLRRVGDLDDVLGNEVELSTIISEVSMGAIRASPSSGSRSP